MPVNHHWMMYRVRYSVVKVSRTMVGVNVGMSIGARCSRMNSWIFWENRLR